MTAIQFDKRPNVRFWFPVDGRWVKFTLRPEQEINFGHYHRTEEGYSATYNTLYYDAEGRIECKTVIEACDCDGRLDQYFDYAAVAYKEGDITPDDAPATYKEVGRVLDWKRTHSSQRDYAAEAMGY